MNEPSKAKSSDFSSMYILHYPNTPVYHPRSPYRASDPEIIHSCPRHPPQPPTSQVSSPIFYYRILVALEVSPTGQGLQESTLRIYPVPNNHLVYLVQDLLGLSLIVLQFDIVV